MIKDVNPGEIGRARSCRESYVKDGVMSFLADDGSLAAEVSYEGKTPMKVYRTLSSFIVSHRLDDRVTVHIRSKKDGSHVYLSKVDANA